LFSVSNICYTWTGAKIDRIVVWKIMKNKINQNLIWALLIIFVTGSTSTGYAAPLYSMLEAKVGFENEYGVGWDNATEEEQEEYLIKFTRIKERQKIQKNKSNKMKKRSKERKYAVKLKKRRKREKKKLLEKRDKRVEQRKEERKRKLSRKKFDEKFQKFKQKRREDKLQSR